MAGRSYQQHFGGDAETMPEHPWVLRPFGAEVKGMEVLVLCQKVQTYGLCPLLVAVFTMTSFDHSFQSWSSVLRSLHSQDMGGC